MMLQSSGSSTLMLRVERCFIDSFFILYLCFQDVAVINFDVLLCWFGLLQYSLILLCGIFAFKMLNFDVSFVGSDCCNTLQRDLFYNLYFLDVTCNIWPMLRWEFPPSNAIPKIRRLGASKSVIGITTCAFV